MEINEVIETVLAEAPALGWRVATEVPREWITDPGLLYFRLERDEGGRTALVQFTVRKDTLAERTPGELRDGLRTLARQSDRDRRN